MTEKKKKSNKFVNFLQKIFMQNALLKLTAFFLAVFLWGVLISFGFGRETQFDISIGFWESCLKNILAAFNGIENIVASCIDLFLFIVLLYLIMKFLNKYKAGLLLRFIIPVLLIAIICTSKVLIFPVMGYVFSNILLIFAIVILVMFPQELRRGMWKLASPSDEESFNTQYDCTEEELREAVNDIVKAVLNMSKNNEGALIAIATQTMPQHIIESGTRMDAVLSQHLIECLFNTKANLHDGAVFIRGNRIVAAGCFLPLSQTISLPKEIGTRHRAALGLSEQYPVLAIVVSEETGIISVCKDGQLERFYDAVMLNDEIQQVFGLKAVIAKKKKGRKLF